MLAFVAEVETLDECLIGIVIHLTEALLPGLAVSGWEAFAVSERLSCPDPERAQLDGKAERLARRRRCKSFLTAVALEPDYCERFPRLGHRIPQTTQFSSVR
ncbi:MAG: hypothetical protein ACHQ01_10210 [Candidatus Limnocylindrales bacterium]